MNLALFKGRKWYHQRFDGCPMFIGFVAEAEPKREKRKPAGTEADVRICFFDDGKCDWYLDMTDIDRGVEVILKLAKQDPKISDKFLAAWKKDEELFDKFFWKHHKADLSKYSLAQLDELWKFYRTLYVNRFTSSAIIDHFSLGTDQLIADMLKKEIGKNNPDLKESDFAKIFAIVSAPTKQSVVGKAEIGLLKIALGESTETLKDHQRKYFWLNNNYIRDQVLTIRDFEKDINSWKASGKDLEEELKRMTAVPIRNKAAKERLFKQCKFSLFLRTLLKISDDLTWWQDERKRSTYLSIHLGSHILQAIARKTGYTLAELKYAVAAEIPAIIQRQSLSRKELQQRMRGSALIATRQGIGFVIGRKKIAKLRKIMFGGARQESVDDFRGLTASAGKAIGKVKVVKSSTEIAKVNAGDILVAVMTRPDYVVAMKKAAAIVTDEGGITSHAAIMSRELGIPCIIGTKIATEVLKDGDLVEVNANHGWVRKLK